jgi:hypothetical protein
MRFQKIALLFIAFLMSICGFSQTYKTQIDQEFNQYLDLVMHKKFDKSMDYLIPEFFELFPKAKIVEAMEKVFNNPAVEFEIKNNTIENIADLQHIRNKYYAMMTYSNQMNMRIKNDKVETDDDKKMRIEMIKLTLQNKFGSNNVNYNSATDFFEVHVVKQAVAISTDGVTQWKFLVFEENQRALLEKLVPKELLKQLK